MARKLLTLLVSHFVLICAKVSMLKQKIHTKITLRFLIIKIVGITLLLFLTPGVKITRKQSYKWALEAILQVGPGSF